VVVVWQVLLLLGSHQLLVVQVLLHQVQVSGGAGPRSQVVVGDASVGYVLLWRNSNLALRSQRNNFRRQSQQLLKSRFSYIIFLRLLINMLKLQREIERGVRRFGGGKYLLVGRGRRERSGPCRRGGRPVAHALNDLASGGEVVRGRRQRRGVVSRGGRASSTRGGRHRGFDGVLLLLACTPPD